MSALLRFTFVGVALSVVAGCAQTVKPDASRLAAVKRIAVVPIPEIEKYEAKTPMGLTLWDSLLWAAVEGDAAGLFAEAVSVRGYDFNVEFPGQLEQAFSGSVYELSLPGSPGASRITFLQSYGEPVPTADAYLDIVPVRVLEFPALGYHTTGGSWIPVGHFSVRLVSAADQEVLYARTIIAGGYPQTPPSGREKYAFEDFRSVIRNIDTAIEGMRYVAAYVAGTIAMDLGGGDGAGVVVESSDTDPRHGTPASELQVGKKSSAVTKSLADGAVTPHRKLVMVPALALQQADNGTCDIASVHDVATAVQEVRGVHLYDPSALPLSLDTNAFWRENEGVVEPDPAAIRNSAALGEVDAVLLVAYRERGSQYCIGVDYQIFLVDRRSGQMQARRARDTRFGLVTEDMLRMLPR